MSICIAAQDWDPAFVITLRFSKQLLSYHPFDNHMSSAWLSSVLSQLHFANIPRHNHILLYDHLVMGIHGVITGVLIDLYHLAYLVRSADHSFAVVEDTSVGGLQPIAVVTWTLV